ncbi:MAG: hypothetical protein ABI372_03580 [Ginsengibacter sp.]
MKKYFFIAVLFFAGNTYAQRPANAVKLVQYTFDAFMPGIVKMKSGEANKQNLNYNIITNEMVFDNNGKYAAIADPGNVDTVYINDRKFIPLNNKFYEVLVGGRMPLLYESTASVSEPGVSTGYGGTTNTSATSSYQSLLRDGSAYNLKLPEGFNVIPKHEFYILTDGKLEKAGSEKRMSKVFSDKKDLIKDFVKKNKTDFSKPEDVAQLVRQIEQ